MSDPAKALLAAQKKLDGGDREGALQQCQQLLSQHPNLAGAYDLLGLIAIRDQSWQQAQQQFEKSLSISRQNFQSFFYLGMACAKLEQHEKALFCLQEAIKLNPRHFESQYELGALLIKHGSVVAASQVLQSAIQLQPKSADAHLLLGNALCDFARPEPAIECYQKALALDPKLSLARSNLLLAYNYLSEPRAEEAYSAAQALWRQALGEESNSPAPLERKADPKKLKVGYVSPDLHEHSVAYFLLPLVSHHDKSKVEVVAYYNNIRQDGMTDRLKACFDQWRDVSGWDDHKLAQQIRDDKIDVLIDLTGHMRKNRLSVFALRPAPLQVTWLGYPNTTGLAAMDMRIVDHETDPQGLTDPHYSESLVRLEHNFICYQGNDQVACSPDLPAKKGEGFTFGSFNNLPKVGDVVVEAWARILKGAPGSRLAIKARQMVDAGVRSHYLGLFHKFGVDPQRIVVLPGMKSQKDHLEMYHRIDLALDTFPYNGTTTTCEALWMGVPTVCFKGEVHAARVSASIMKYAGFEQFVAEDLDGYVEQAISWTNRTDELESVRRQARETMLASPLCDAKGFAAEFEQVLFDAYQS